MKVTIEANDIRNAVQDYVATTFGMSVTFNPQEFEDKTLNVKPMVSQSINFPRKPLDTKDVERVHAIERADELGIEYHPNIGTDKLIKRIEEHEDEIASRAIESVQEMSSEPEEDTEEDIAQEDLEKASERTTGSLPELEDEEDLFPAVKPAIPTKKSIFDRTP